MTDACYSNAIDRDHDSGLRQTLCWPRSSASLFSTFSSFFFISASNNAFPFTFAVYITRAPRIATVSICSTEFLFLPSLLFTRFLRFAVCPLCFFSEFSSPLPCFLSFHLITPNPVSPFTLPIFLKIFHLIRSQA